MPFYGTQQWDPKLIFCQIVAIQAISYVSMGILLQLLHLLSGTEIILDQFFASDLLNFETTVGWTIITVTLINSIIGAVTLFFIVERAKKCLDFAFTTHLIHLILCSAYSAFPYNWQWWFINIISLIIMASLGEYLCARLELREIRVTDFLNLKTDRSNIV